MTNEPDPTWDNTRITWDNPTLAIFPTADEIVGTADRTDTCASDDLEDAE